MHRIDNGGGGQPFAAFGHQSGANYVGIIASATGGSNGLFCGRGPCRRDVCGFIDVFRRRGFGIFGRGCGGGFCCTRLRRFWLAGVLRCRWHGQQRVRRGLRLRDIRVHQLHLGGLRHQRKRIVIHGYAHIRVFVYRLQVVQLDAHLLRLQRGNLIGRKLHGGKALLAVHMLL